MNKTKIVALAVFFNLTFEYSMRGPRGLFSHIGLLLLLVLLYSLYFFTVDSLIRRYGLTNLQTLAVAFSFGILIVTFFSGDVFVGATVLGINPLRFLFINVVWWGFFQTLLALYFANRTVRRDAAEDALGTGALAACIGAILVAVALLHAVANTPKGSPPGYLVSLSVLVILLAYLVLSLRHQEPNESASFRKSTLLDVLAFGSLAICFVLGTFVAGSHPSATGSLFDSRAASLSAGWTVIVLVGLAIYYVRTRKAIPI